MAKIGPHSRHNTLATIDGRRREAKLLKTFRAELTEHVGGKPSAVQKVLIDRASFLQLRISLMDAATAPSGVLSEKNAREYLVWANSLVRTLRQLGIEGAEKPAQEPTLVDYISAKSTGSVRAPS